ncbi:S-ribosylhomocysteine lyase [Clostridium pascui]|uniref:S-ribosylhomocysteine lyase n=1 Tax=Clostridium pascui TaxID=46609 RepID=UPI00195F21E3|nr:S-ribosylhomocysteine lyase [Clostridium pascui]MBM7870469.1 S-ribosylhomocysteine lyase [Clostridium pascui]
MEKVESFQLDHRKVIAPYVRKAVVLNGKKGDKVTKFDLRFLQPNQEAMPTASLHALEHLLAGYLREHLDNVIDLSPMGCRTGFYLILWGDVESTTVKSALEVSLKQVLQSDEVPAANNLQCGNYRDLSLFGAKEYARYVLDKGFSTTFYKD